MAEYWQANRDQSPLITLKSPAWGHILRFAYALPTAASLELLTQKSVHLPQYLKNVLSP